MAGKNLATKILEAHLVEGELVPGKEIGNNREHGHFPTATLRWRSVSPFGKMADLTDKTKLV